MVDKEAIKSMNKTQTFKVKFNNDLEPVKSPLLKKNADTQHDESPNPTPATDFTQSSVENRDFIHIKSIEPHVKDTHVHFGIHTVHGKRRDAKDYMVRMFLPITHDIFRLMES